MSDIKEEKKSPLYENHKKLHAFMTNFNGWELPLRYTTPSSEHLHTKYTNSIFDNCHAGLFMIEGTEAEKDLEALLCCSVSTLPDKTSSYGFFLNKDGGFIDDIVILKYSSEKFMLIIKASHIETDKEWILEHLSDADSLTDLSSSLAVIDLIGPRAFKSASTAFPENSFTDMGRFSFKEFDFNGIPLTACSTGCTGCIGFNFMMPPGYAPKIWEHLLNVDTVEPAGLKARETLRLEHGLPHYGLDITDKITPAETALENHVDYSKDFIGKDALLRLKKKPARQFLVPFLCAGKKTAESGYAINIGGKQAGTVTSCVFSPTLNKGIGFALLNRPAPAVGTIIECIEKDIKINAIIVDLPFTG